MTGTAGTLGAAAAVGRLLRLDAQQMLSALGTAGTEAAGLWQFLSDATHSKQVHTAKASFDGLFAAYTARDGLLGTSDVLEGKQGMGFAMSTHTNPAAIDEDLGGKFSVLETSFKWHASCRHTHPCCDALLELLRRHPEVQMADIDYVKAFTYQSAIDVLSLSEQADTVHQSKFSMGFVLAVAAKYGRAMISDFTEAALRDTDLRAFQKRVSMVLDDAIDAAFPAQWLGRVEVGTRDGHKYSQTIDEPKGDPGNSLIRQELETKAKALGEYAGIQNPMRLEQIIRCIWQLEQEDDMMNFICK